MGVLSKALRFAIFASIILSGCAVSPSVTDPDNAVNDSTAGIAGADAMLAESSEEQPGDTVVAASVGDHSPLLQYSDDLSDGIVEDKDALRMERGEGFSRCVINTQLAEPAFDVIKMSEPPRLVVDVAGTLDIGTEDFSIGEDRFLNGIRIGSHEDRTRFVFDLKSDDSSTEHLVDAQGSNIIVTFLNTSQPAVEEIAAKPSMGPITLSSLTLSEKEGDGGLVRLELSQPVAFALGKSAPTEYVLSMPGVLAEDLTTIPQIAHTDASIRSARAVQLGEDVLVRMFVAPEVELQARSEGSVVIVKAAKKLLAQRPDARAQMSEELPEGARAQVEVDPDESTARENPTGIRAADGSKVYTGRLISLDLQDTDIDNALRIIAEVSNLNIIASDDVSGKVTLRLIDVPWDQALDVILKTNGLGSVTEGNVIRIAPIDKLQQEAEALNRAKIAQRQLEDLAVEYVRISYARAEDVKQHVEGVLTERGTVTADDRTNQLILRDTKMGLEAARELITKLDLRTPQVLLETQIVEGQRNVLRDLGFQWNFSYIQSPETGNATGLNFPNTVEIGGGTTDGTSPLTSNFPAVLSGAGSAISVNLDSADGSRALSARLSMLETDGKVKVVSRPQVATINNKQAVVKSVETVRVRLPDSGTSVGIGTGASASGGGSTAFEEIDVGIELTVTPQASPDYFVLLDINARSSTFGGERVDNIPSTLEREATSTILVKSGQTFALGGVYRLNDQDTVEGVPWFKDIPVLGMFFRRTFVTKTDEELIFFITPHIVEGSFDEELMQAKEEDSEEELS